MFSDTYALSPFAGVLNHFAQSVVTAQDRADSELDAQVHSGDYFVMLATTLDLISQTLQADTYDSSASLQCLVDDLIYLNKHYTIIKKAPLN